MNRWDHLKGALIEQRSKLGESQTLQQFSRDADEVENWIAEKVMLILFSKILYFLQILTRRNNVLYINLQCPLVVLSLKDQIEVYE